MALGCLGDFDRIGSENVAGQVPQSLDALLEMPKARRRATGRQGRKHAYKPTGLLTVYLDAHGQRQKIGRLASRDRRILFEYDAAFLASGIEFSPFKLPLKPGVFTPDTAVFDGLFGVFNDSLPDGWGRLLLDRTVECHGIHRGQLNPLDRLAYVGSHGMGALSYEPELGEHGAAEAPLALDKLAEESATILEEENEEIFEELLRLNGIFPGSSPQDRRSGE